METILTQKLVGRYPKFKKIRGGVAKIYENSLSGIENLRNLVELIEIFKKISEVDPNIQENSLTGY